VTRSLLWRGVSLAEPLPDKGIHCSGITFEVYVRALQRAAGEGASGPSPEELLALKESWYVREEGSDGGPVDALARHGLGQSITDPEQLQPGDFVQWWRNNKKGHSAIFIQHTRNGDGSLRGMVYWSAQGTSKGIGQRRVSIGEDINQITPGRLYGVRALRPG
jgi:hypothetical protein